MKKKLIDLTIEELKKICDTHKNCLDCPCIIDGSYDRDCWRSLVENGIKNKEVEVLENGKD